jgi:hypothetical protein
MKILLILFVIDSLIKYLSKNYIRNDIFNFWKHALTNTPASIIYMITSYMQIILGLVIIIKFIIMI